MGEMSVMGREGDLKVKWNHDNADEVAAARKQFDELRAKGFVGFRVTGNRGEAGEQIDRFDPNLEAVILVPPMVGG